MWVVLLYGGNCSTCYSSFEPSYSCRTAVVVAVLFLRQAATTLPSSGFKPYSYRIPGTAEPCVIENGICLGNQTASEKGMSDSNSHVEQLQWQ